MNRVFAAAKLVSIQRTSHTRTPVVMAGRILTKPKLSRIMQNARKEYGQEFGGGPAIPYQKDRRIWVQR